MKNINTDFYFDLCKIYKYTSIVYPKFNERKTAFENIFSTSLKQLNKIKTDKDYFILLSKLFASLNDGHTYITMPQSLRKELGYLPFDFICINNEYYIKSATSEFKELVLKQIKSINGVEFNSLLKECFKYIHHNENFTYWNKIEQILPLLLKQRNNKITTTDYKNYKFNLNAQPQEKVGFSTIKSSFKYKEIVNNDYSLFEFENDIIYLKLDSFNNSNLINNCVKELKKLKKAKAIIIDVRNNEGGITKNAEKIAELFFNKPFSDSIKLTTQTNGLDLASASQYACFSEEKLNEFITNGITTKEIIEKNLKTYNGETFKEYSSTWGSNKKAVFTSPCYILTSRYTISAAEDFVAMFKSNNRASIIGDNTYGSTGTPFMLKLSNGFNAKICSVHYTLLDKTEFINIGIKPDIKKCLTINDLRTGKDTVLDYAIKYINNLKD